MKSVCRKACQNCPYTADEILSRLAKVNKVRRKMGLPGRLPEEAYEVCSAQHQKGIR